MFCVNGQTFWHSSGWYIMGLLCVALLCSQVISSQNDNTHVTFAVFVFGGMCLWFWAKQATNSLQCFTLQCCVRLKAGCVSGSCSMSSKWPPWVPSQQLLQFLTRQTHRTHFIWFFSWHCGFQVYLESSGYFPVYFVYVWLPRGEKPPPRSGLVDLCLYFHCSLVTRMVF